MKGLHNLGNTCYLNSALQCLLFCPHLTNYFLHGLYEADANKRKKNASRVVDEYASLVKQYWSGSSGATALDPEPLAAAFRKLWKRFVAGQQHDAHDALHCLLQALHDGTSKTAAATPHSKATAVLRGAALDAWHEHNRGNYSFVTEVFQGQLRKTVGGDVHYEHFMDLSLALTADVKSVAAAIAQHLAPTVPEGSGATVGYQPTYLPLALVLHLKRFDNKLQKVERFVDYPVTLDLSSLTGRQEDTYALFAVCFHSGQYGSGHYVACCNFRNTWYVLNDDSSVVLKDINQLVSSNAYFLIYKKLG